MQLKAKLRVYYFTAIFSVIFALIGFSYNAWRMEVSEDNNNIRTASFEVLIALADFEQVIYAAHYDQDEIDGSPRLGWVKIGLARDLSPLVSEVVEQEMGQLVDIWTKNWPKIFNERQAADELIESISIVRNEIKNALKSLD